MNFILLLSCKDQPGLVSKISSLIFALGGNIHSLDEYADINEKQFFIRVAWGIGSQDVVVSEIEARFASLGKQFSADWALKNTAKKLRVAIFVSRYDHCLREILWRYGSDELPIDIPLIISNHDDFASLAEHHGIPYYVFPITAENKRDQERDEIALMAEHDIDTIVLARYMQVLSEEFVSHYPNQIINIHHSFLPAFIGGNPYKQAHDRGVKIIGATSHYVTSDLDEGPIIEQDIVRISHRETREELIRKGRDVERLVLARALDAHVNHRVLVSGHKTIVFN